MAKAVTRKTKKRETIPVHIDKFLELLARWTVEEMNINKCTGKEA